MQQENALLWIAHTVWGQLDGYQRWTISKWVWISCTFSRRTSFNLLQPWNIMLPIPVKVDGILMTSNEIHFSNPLCLMYLSLSFNVTSLKLVQFTNVKEPDRMTDELKITFTISFGTKMPLDHCGLFPRSGRCRLVIWIILTFWMGDTVYPG